MTKVTKEKIKSLSLFNKEINSGLEILEGYYTVDGNIISKAYRYNDDFNRDIAYHLSSCERYYKILRNLEDERSKDHPHFRWRNFEEHT